MRSFKNNANMTWSAADMFAVCSSCAKNASSTSSFNNSDYGTVLMAVPFFVLAAIICLSCNVFNISIILGLLIALIIISLAMQCCHSVKLNSLHKIDWA